ncbi:MAG: porphobilinogen synthase, partial [Thermoflexibacter sp.]|nr:porphobilinogen synthase [Thermoflexibacter sp.]
MQRRPRRNRQSEVIRNLAEETRLSTKDLIFPIFLTDGQDKKIPIPSMPAIYRLSLDHILREIEECMNLEIKAFAPFPQVDDSLKDPLAKESYQPQSLYLRAIRQIKQHFPEA